MTMDPEEKSSDAGEIRPVFKRPLLLTAVCIAAFVHFGLLAILFLLATLKSGWIREVVNRYLDTGQYTSYHLFFLFGAAFLLHSLAFTGLILVWKLRRTGFYLLCLACIVLSIYQLFNSLAPLSSVGIYIAFLLLTGIFFRKMQ
jgi:hypothetical protein